MIIHPLLRVALGANAVFSGLAGLVLLVWAEPLGQRIGVSSTLLLRLIASGLLAFAAQLAWVAKGKRADPNNIKMFTGLDLAWVVATVLVLVVPSPLNGAGRWLLIAIGLIVADFAFLQWWGLRKSETLSKGHAF